MWTTGSSSTPHAYSTSSSSSPHDDWRPISDPSERRKIQNRLAQRKYRERARQQREEAIRREYDERMAGGAYTPPDPKRMARETESGLPWGSFSFRHVVETGQARQQQMQERRFGQQQNQSRNPHQQFFTSQPAQQQPQAQQYHPQYYQPQPLRYYDPQMTAQTGGSSRVGLHLADDYARGPRLWQAWQATIPRSASTTNHPSSVTTNSSMVSDWP